MLSPMFRGQPTGPSKAARSAPYGSRITWSDGMRTIIGGMVVILFLITPAHPQPRSQGAVPVGVVTAAKQPVARSAEFVGRIEAIERVDLRARVTGYLDAVLFKE